MGYELENQVFCNIAFVFLIRLFWLSDEDIHIYIPDAKSAKDLIRYTDQTIEGMSSGLFAFLALPDLCMAHGRKWDSDVKDLESLQSTAFFKNLMFYLAAGKQLSP